MKHSRSSLFLMEMILSLLFFSLSAIVCVQLFVRAHKLSLQTSDLNQAHLHAQSLAECFLASEGDLTLVQDWMKDFSPSLTQVASGAESNINEGKNALFLYFDREWESTDYDHASFLASLVLLPEEADRERRLKKATVTVSCLDDGSDLYSLPLTLHVSGQEVIHE